MPFWRRSTCPACADGTALLPLAAPDLEDATGCWCPSCDGRFTTRDPKAPRPVYVERHPLTGEALGVPYELRLEPDGMVLLVIGPQCWRLSTKQAKGFAGGMSSIATASRERLASLRGADVWAFRKDDGEGGGAPTYFARHLDTEVQLDRFVARAVSRSRSSCWACHGPIAKGAPAYKASAGAEPKPLNEHANTHAPWGAIRVCVTCVESNSIPTAFGPLRLIDGGKARVKRASRA